MGTTLQTVSPRTGPSQRYSFEAQHLESIPVHLRPFHHEQVVREEVEEAEIGDELELAPKRCEEPRSTAPKRPS